MTTLLILNALAFLWILGRMLKLPMPDEEWTNKQISDFAFMSFLLGLLTAFISMLTFRG